MPAIQATYQLLVDLDGDNDFADSGEDLFSYLVEADTEIGMESPHDLVAIASQGKFILKNADKRFSPESGSALSGFRRGRALKWVMTYPSNQNGTYTGVTLGNTGINSSEIAPYFDGTGDRANVFNSAWATNNASGSFKSSNGWFGTWAKVDAVGTWIDGTLRALFRLTNGSDLIQVYKAATGQIVANYVAGGVTETVTSAIQSTPDWLYIVLKWITDGPSSSFSLYINEVLIGTSATLGTWGNALTAAVIGALDTSGTGSWKGYLAHASLSNIAFNSGVVGTPDAPDISMLYAAKNTDYRAALKDEASRGGLVFYFPLNETGATTQAINEITQQTLYTGRISEINPTTGIRGDRLTEVICDGYLYEVAGIDIFMPVQQTKRTDELVASMIAASRLYPPGFSGWFAGVPGYSEAGVTTIAGSGVNAYALLETGRATLPLFGDNLNKGKARPASIRSALEKVVEAEQGRLFESRRGRITFLNRHHMAQDLRHALDVTLTDSAAEPPQYRYGKRLLNKLTMKVHPRTTDSVPSTLGTLDRAVKMEAGEVKPITINYLDDNGNRIGGIDLIAPVANTDYTANTAEDGSGVDVTSSVSVALEDGGDRAKWTVTNGYPQFVYIQAGATQRGTKITDYGDLDITVEDEESIRDNRLAQEAVDYSAIEDVAYAEQLARWMVESQKDPKGEIESVSFKANRSAILMKYALQNTIGDRGQFSEGQSGADGEYFIVGERHIWQNKVHQTEWVLEPVGQTYWIAGVNGFSNAEVSTRAGV